jgi:hypothetical protein
LKAKAALAAVAGSSVGQVGSRFSVHPTQVATWKKRLLEGAEELFADGRRRLRIVAAIGTTVEQLQWTGRWFRAVEQWPNRDHAHGT